MLVQVSLFLAIAAVRSAEADKRNESIVLLASSRGSSYSRGFIYSVDLEEDTYQSISTLGNLDKVLTVGFDPVGNRMYWAEASSGYNRIRSSSLDGGGVVTVFTVRDKRNSSSSPVEAFEGLAVDPLSRLIFYTDAQGKQIAMLTMTSPPQKRNVALSDLYQPRAIALDTANGVVYWTDVGPTPKIERANYDGSDRRTVVSTDLTSPNGLAIDVPNNKLYWVDSNRDRVESSDLEGNNRVVLYQASSSGSYRQYYGLALLDDTLYITSRGLSSYSWSGSSSYYSSYLLRLPLGSNTTGVTRVFSVNSRLDDIFVYSGKNRDLGPNGCGDNGCRNICIPLPSNRSKCACPENYEFSSKGTCVDINACSGNFTALTGVIQSPNYPNNHGNNLNCTYVITVPEGYRITLNFTSLDLESCCDKVEIRDGGNDNAPLLGRYCEEQVPLVERSFGNQLFIRLVTDPSVTSTGFSATYTTDGDGNFFLLARNGGGFYRSYNGILLMYPDTLRYGEIPMEQSLQYYRPQAVDYDPVERRVYWTDVDSFEGRIMSSYFNGSNVEMVLNVPSKSYYYSSRTGMEGIAVDPLSRLIFFTDAKNNRVVMVTMSSPRQQITVATSDVDSPRAIALDTANGVVFWTDVGSPEKIERANYDGSDRRTVASNLTSALTFFNGLAIDVQNKKLYWVDGGRTNRVESSDLDGNNRTILYEPPSDSGSSSSYTFARRHYYALALFQNVLYFTSKKLLRYRHNTYLMKMPLGPGVGNVTQVSLFSDEIMDIHIHKAADSDPNGCGSDNGGCSVICIPLPSNRSKCACPNAQQLAHDGKSCAPQVCGGTYSHSSGRIHSPNFPGMHGNNLNCTYLITAPEGYRITLNFTHLDLESVSDYYSHIDDCDYDYIEIREGDDETAPLLGRFCDEEMPFVLQSFGNRLFIRLITDDTVDNTGFNTFYTAEEKDDHFLLVTSSMTSSSPYSNNDAIYRVDPDTGAYYNITMSQPLYNPLALDYDPVEQRIYWTEKGPVVNRIRSAFLNGSHPQSVSIADTPTSQAALEGIAVDPLSRLIFYTDAGHHEIVMLTMTTPPQRKSVVTSGLKKPRAIVLDTANGVIYWTDWGPPAKIERANYDGSDRRTVVSMGLNITNGLAVDVTNNKLYWVDAGTSLVESSDLDGNNRAVLYRANTTSEFFGLALSQTSLYITEWIISRYSKYRSYLLKLPLTDEGLNTTQILTTGERLNDVHAYHQKMLDSGLNGCGNNRGGCSDFCIPLPGNRSKCACFDGEKLRRDGKSCGNTSITITTTTTTTTTTTPIPKIVNAYIKTSESMPFHTDGSRELTLTCDLEPSEPAIGYTWSVTCLDLEDTPGNQCVWKPALEDDGTAVTCQVTLSNDRKVLSSPFNLSVAWTSRHPGAEEKSTSSASIVGAVIGVILVVVIVVVVFVIRRKHHKGQLDSTHNFCMAEKSGMLRHRSCLSPSSHQ